MDFGRNSDRKIINYDEIEKNLHLVDFWKLIQKVWNRVKIDWRFAIIIFGCSRKMSEKQIIEWDVEKTNSDYLWNKRRSTERRFCLFVVSVQQYLVWRIRIDEKHFHKSQNRFREINKKSTMDKTLKIYIALLVLLIAAIVVIDSNRPKTHWIGHQPFP